MVLLLCNEQAAHLLTSNVKPAAHFLFLPFCSSELRLLSLNSKVQRNCFLTGTLQRLVRLVNIDSESFRSVFASVVFWSVGFYFSGTFRAGVVKDHRRRRASLKPRASMTNLFTTFEEETGRCNTCCDVLCTDFSRLQLNKCNLLYIFVFFIRFEL